MNYTIQLVKCTCGADAHLLSPSWYNALKGYKVVCITKRCGIETKEYTRKRNARNAWNKLIKSKVKV